RTSSSGLLRTARGVVPALRLALPLRCPASHAVALPLPTRPSSPPKVQTNTPTAQRPMRRLRTRAGDVTNTPTSQRPKRTAPPPRDDTLTPPLLTRGGKIGEQPHLHAEQSPNEHANLAAPNVAAPHS